MTDKEINETIALHLGWAKETKEIEHQDGYQWTEVVTHWRIPGGARISLCPDYCNDLNAMHGAEITLRGDQWDRYAQHLRDVVLANRRYFLIVATARQRAEAFLRTIGNWRGE